MKIFKIVSILILAFAIAIAGYFIGNMHKTGKKFDRYVQVKGLSEREVNADLAVWPIIITLTGNDLKLLNKNIEKQSKEVFDFFVKQGFSKNEITIGITNINDALADQYNNNNVNSKNRYLSKSEFTVRTNDIQKLKKTLTASLNLTAKGILISSKNTWQPITYSFTGLNKLKPPMIEEATKNAREVAEKFARDSNSNVGKIKLARQGLFTINNRDENTPEIKIVRIVSTIDFQLED